MRAVNAPVVPAAAQGAAIAAPANPERIGTQPGLALTQPSTAGSRLGLTPLQTPASVAIISGDTIRARGDKTIAEAESRAVGVTAVPFTGTGNNALSARGFYGVNSINQLYDGKQLFNAGGVVAFPVDPWNVDRIEILGGSSSVLFGTGGVGGAFNVIPKAPDPVKTSAAAEAWLGSFNTTHLAFDVTGPVSPVLSYRFDVSQNASNGFTRPAGNSDSLALSGALRFQPTADFVTTLRNDYGNIRPSTYEGTPTAYGRAIEALRYTNFNVSDGYIVFRQNYLSLKQEWTPASNLAFTNETYFITQYRRYREGATFAFNPATNNVARTMFRDISANQYQIGERGTASAKYKAFGFANETLFGFELNMSNYYRQDNQSGVGSSTGTSTVNAYNFNPGIFANTRATPARPQYVAELQQSGAFAENRVSLLDNLSFISGVRGDHYEPRQTPFNGTAAFNSRFGGAGYNFGLIYNPLPEVALYGRYAVSTDPVTSLGNISATTYQFALSPARQIEIGTKASFFDTRLESTLALYRIVKNNLLAPTLANAAIMETVGQQSSQGIEGSLAYRLFEDVRVEANGTLLQAKFDNFLAAMNGGVVNLAGRRPQFVPTRTANVLARWSFWPDWEVRGALRFVGDRFSDNPNLYKLPAYNVVDVGLRWDATKNFSVDLRVTNVTNAAYAVSTYAGNGTQLILGEPRAVFGTVKARF